MGNMDEQCESQCGEHKCQLPDGHKDKHRNGGAMWTTAGAERVNAELAALKDPQ
jgi:hypothetical protein